MNHSTEYLWIPISVVAVVAALALCYVLYTLIRLGVKHGAARNDVWVGACQQCDWVLSGTNVDAVGNALERHVIATHRVDVMEQVKNDHDRG